MSNIDKKFVDNLSDFSKSLEELVKLLQDQIKNKSTDTVTKMLEKMDDKLTTVVTELKAVRKEAKEIKRDTGDILKAVKEMKSTKKDGVSSDLGGKSPNTIAEGVKSMILIAAGVLAIGLAFKIVGKVDFLSVLALSAAIYTIALVFEKLAKIEALSIKKVTGLSIMMVIMAGAIAISGMLLNLVPNMSLMTMLSVLVVTVSMTIAFWGLSKAIHHMKLTDMPKMLLLPMVLPLMAAGIVAAGFILQNMPDVKWEQALSAGMVGLALVPVAFAFAILVKGLKNTKPQDILMACAAIPMMALATVLAGFILGTMPEVKWEVIVWSWATALAILPMAVLIAAFSKLKVSIKDLAFGSIGIVMISAAIMISSLILSIGTYEKYPPAEWSLGVGLSMLLFGAAAVLVGLFITSTGPAFWLGLVGVVALSAVVLVTSFIIGVGKYEKYPATEWTLGMGLTMLIFGTAAIVIGLFAITPVFWLGLLGVIALAATIVEVAKIIEKGKFEKFPSQDWAEGVGRCYLYFGLAAIGIGLFAITPIFWIGLLGLLAVAASIVEVDKILGKGKFDKFPSLDWSLGVGLSMLLFSKSIMIMGIAGIFDAISSIFGVGGGDMSKKLNPVAKSMIEVAKILNDPVWSQNMAHPSKEWSEGVGGAIAGFAEALGYIDDEDIDAQTYAAMIGIVAGGLVTAAKVLQESSTPGFWQGINEGGNFPSKEWSEGVAKAIGGFSEAFKTISGSGGGFFGIGSTSNEELMLQFQTFIKMVTMSMIGVATDLNNAGDIFLIYPNSDWVDGISSATSSFTDMFKKIKEFGDYGDIAEACQSLLYMGRSVWMFSVILKNVDSTVFEKDGLVNKIADSMERLKKALPTINDGAGLMQLGRSILIMIKALDNINGYKITQLLRLSHGMEMMSLIDEQKLAQVLTVINKKKEELHSIMDTGGYGSMIMEGFGNLLTSAGNFLGIGSRQTTAEIIEPKKQTAEEKEKNEQMTTLVNYVQNIDTNIGKLVTVMVPSSELNPENVND